MAVALVRRVVTAVVELELEVDVDVSGAEVCGRSKRKRAGTNSIHPLFSLLIIGGVLVYLEPG